MVVVGGLVLEAQIPDLEGDEVRDLGSVDCFEASGLNYRHAFACIDLAAGPHTGLR